MNSRPTILLRFCIDAADTDAATKTDATDANAETDADADADAGQTEILDKTIAPPLSPRR